MVADPRFSGGTAAALVSDVRAFSALGLRVELLTIDSRFFGGAADRPNAEVLALPDLPGVVLVEGSASADTAFLHHPLAFFHGIRERVAVTARRAVLVAHHPPFPGDGSLEYSPLATNRRVRATFGCWPWWAPVSGVVRAQLRSFSPLLTMTSEDWVNTFDAAGWRAARPVFETPRATVGRHGRTDVLKWPDTAADVVPPLAPGPGWTTRVMGCPWTRSRGWESTRAAGRCSTSTRSPSATSSRGSMRSRSSTIRAGSRPSAAPLQRPS